MRNLTIFLTIAALLAPGIVCALDDTPENRAAQVERYLRAVPPLELMEDMADNMATTLPPEHRDDFRRMMLVHVDNDKIIEAMTESMIRHFTADELAAIADLYESPVGKSAMDKMGVYMADVMPVIMVEIRKAVQALKEEQQKQAQDSESM